MTPAIVLDVAAGLAIAGLVVLGWRALWFLTDDAYIAFRYASNLLSGRGLVWNAAPFVRVEGYTSFLWVVLLAGVWRLTGLEPPVTANVLSLFAGFGSLAIGLAWLRRLPSLAASGLRERTIVWLAVLGIASDRSFLTWLSSGLETALFDFLFLWWLFECFELSEASGIGARLRLTTSAALLALCRPDGLLAVAATPLALAACPARGRRLGAELAAQAPLLGVATHLLWRRAYYGFWVPNTYYAKHLGAWPEAGARYLGCFVLEYGYWLLLVFAGIAWWRGGFAVRLQSHASLRRSAPRALALAVLVAHAFYYTFVIGGDHFEYRVYSHLVIPLWILAADVVCRAFRTTPARAAALASLLIASWGLSWAQWAATKDVQPSRSERHAWVVKLAGRTPAPFAGVVAVWDDWQEWLIGRYVCVRWHEHREFERYYRALLPRRLSNAQLGTEGPPVLALPSVGIAGWMLPDAFVIDEFGLNDRVVARTTAPTSVAQRRMAHDRAPPPGYVECFRPNLLLSNRGLERLPHVAPLTAERIRECERIGWSKVSGG